jgi:hypothetical protein
LYLAFPVFRQVQFVIDDVFHMNASGARVHTGGELCIPPLLTFQLS